MKTGLQRPAHGGYTILEIMIVLSIIVLLLAGGAALMVNLVGDGDRVRAAADIQALETSLVRYKTMAGTFPSQAQGLKALVERPSEGRVPDNWRRLVEPRAIIDPWGNPYQFRYPGKRKPETYDIFSTGPDQAEGTADDIGNWSAGGQ